MADRIVHVVCAKPRRRVGFGAGLAVFIVAVVLLASWLSAAAPAARTVRHNTRVSSRAKTHQSSAQQSSAQQINADVTRLISKMTVAEKFGQLEMAGPDGPNGTPGDLVSEAQSGQIGSVLDLVGVANINQVQQAALNSRLHIPLIFGLDVIHGYKTIFPVPLAEASSWDPALVQNDEAVSADEATADGIKWTFNPMVDIARDPRWARARTRSSALRSRRRRFVATRAPISVPRTRWRRRSSISRPMALRWRVVNTTRLTCRPSSCSTTICRPTRRRSTLARRRSWPRSTRWTACPIRPIRTR